MTWRHVFRRDIKSGYRSRNFPAVALLMVLSTFGIVALMAFLANPEYPPPMNVAVMILGGIISFLVPLAALLSTYSAIVGERTTGSVRFLLGLPNSRRDVFVGKFLSRSFSIVVPLLGGMVLSGLVVASSFEDGAFLPIVGLGLLGAVYAVLFVAIGLGASVYADTDTRAVAIVIGVFALLRAGWPAIQWAGLETMADPWPEPEWYFWLGRVNPINAFVKLTTAFGDVENHPLLTRPYSGEYGDAPPLETVATSMEFAAVVLAVVTIVAPVVGFLYFRQRDML